MIPTLKAVKSSLLSSFFCSFRLLNLGQNPVSIGGGRDFQTIYNNLEMLTKHEFVGCIRRFELEGADLLTTPPLYEEGVTDTCPRASSASICGANTCGEHGACVDEWSRVLCLCDAGYSGDRCEKQAEPFVFGGSAFVTYVMWPAYQRDQILVNSLSRRKHALPDARTISVHMRTAQTDGLLVYTVAGDAYILLVLSDGELLYSSRAATDAMYLGGVPGDVMVVGSPWTMLSG